MEILIVLVIAVLLTIFFRIRWIGYVKRKISNSWAKLPEEKFGEGFDEKKALESMKVLTSYFPGKYHVDGISWQDLDMFKVFKLFNKDYTSMGADYLYTMLRNYGGENYDIEEFQKLKDAFDGDENFRKKVEYRLARIGKNKNYSLPLYIENMDKDKLGISPIVFMPMSIICFLSLVLAAVAKSLGWWIFGYALGIGFFMAAFNLILYSFIAGKIKGEFVNIGYLATFINCAGKIGKFRFANSKSIDICVEKLSGIGFWGQFVERDIVELTEGIYEQLKRILLLPLISYGKVYLWVKQYKADIIRLYMEIGKIEAAISVLNYEKIFTDISRPQFKCEPGMEALEIYHPLIKKPVVNPVDFTNVNIVTGSNASGKSTYVKSIAINAILAQAVNLVHGKSLSMRKGGVLSSMAIRDDIEAGESYFIAEIKSLKRIIEDVKAGNASYYFIDEILKGTNTVERISASASFIDYLIKNKALAFVASHDIELTGLFGNSVTNIHFSETVDDKNGVSFDYRLKAGPSKSRNAIKLLGVMGFPEEIVEDAKKRADS